MGEVKDNITIPDSIAVDSTVNAAINAGLPTDTSTGFWGKIKSFFLQEVEEDNFWFKKITLEPVDSVKPKKSLLFRNIILS